jgi:hypothetical protein
MFVINDLVAEQRVNLFQGELRGSGEGPVRGVRHMQRIKPSIVHHSLWVTEVVCNSSYEIAHDEKVEELETDGGQSDW